MVLIFHDGNPEGLNRLKLHGLDTSYLLQSKQLKSETREGEDCKWVWASYEGLNVSLPDPYLAIANYKLECMEPDVCREFENKFNMVPAI